MFKVLFINLFSLLIAIDETIEIDASSFTEWKYFSFDNEELIEVLIDEPTASCEWDLGVMRNHFRTNSGASGICDGGVYIDSNQVFTDNVWNNFNYVESELEFIEDGILDNIYDIVTHTYSSAPGSNILETWGWFDFDNNYQFNPTNYKYVVRSSDGLVAYKVWLQDYYNELGQSAHITLRYSTDINFIACSGIGDINGDGGYNVLDVVALIDCVLSQYCIELDNSCAADINGDGGYNILDIVELINCILLNNCSGRIDDATLVTLICNNNSIELISDGYIGALYLSLKHDKDFNFEFKGHYNSLSNYKNINNKTHIILIEPLSEEILTINGNYQIIDLEVANSTSMIYTDIVYPSSYVLGNAYPNPFNPTTYFELILNNNEEIDIGIYDILGNKITNIYSGILSKGEYNFNWDAQFQPSGVYFLKVSTKEDISTQKLVLIK